jgi:hypothetical protein
MKTIIIPADLTEHYYASLNAALVFDKKLPVDIVLSFSKGTEDHQIEAKFNEIKSKYYHKFAHKDSSLRFVKEEGLSDSSCGDISPSNENLILLTYNKEEPDKIYSVENTIKFIRGCRQNYFTFPQNKVPSSIKKIMFPVHILTKIRHKVTFTSRIAAMFDAEVHVVTVQTSTQKDIVKRLNLYTLQVINHLKNYGIRTHLETLEGKKIPQMILDYAKSSNSDAISIIPEDITGPRFFSKGFLFEMIEDAEVPLFITAPRKAKITGSFSASG